MTLKKAKVNCLSVSGRNNKIHRPEHNEILGEHDFPEGVFDEYLESGHLKEYKGKSDFTTAPPKVGGKKSEEAKAAEEDQTIEQLVERLAKCTDAKAIKDEFTYGEILKLSKHLDVDIDSKKEDDLAKAILSKK